MTTPLAPLCRVARAWLSGRPPEAVDLDACQGSIRLAEEQRILPILHDVGRQSPLPDDVAEAARSAYYRAHLRNQGLLAAADRTVGILHEAGIAAARLKGADLLIDTWPQAGLRPMDDVDLLIRPRDLDRAVKLLEERGYRRPPGVLPLAVQKLHHFHVPLVEPRHGAYVEVHWQLMDSFKRGTLEIGSIWSELQPMDPDRPERGLRLESSLNFVYLTLHIAKHGPFNDLLRERVGAERALVHAASEVRLLWFLDLALVARRHAVAGERIHEVAAGAGVQQTVAEVLKMGRELLGDWLPGPGPYAPRGALERAVRRLIARLLLARSRPAQGVLRWAGRMQKLTQVRPLRVLELPLALARRGRSRPSEPRAAALRRERA